MASASSSPPTAVAGCPRETSRTSATVAIPSPTYETSRAVHSDRNAAFRPSSPHRPSAGLAGPTVRSDGGRGRGGELWI
jgi:hypothetical protein